jgi:hypothetical protein
VPPRLAAVPELENELDRLYALPLDDFTPARNDLAKRLRAAGQTEEADKVKSLKKPSVAVWAANQLARRQPDAVDALLAAGGRLRDAQARALRGEDPTAVREATAAERAAIHGLTRAAERLLAEERAGASQQMIERVAATLRGAVLDPSAAELLRAGRLPEEPQTTGFGALATLVPPGRAKRRASSARATPDAAAKRARAQERRLLEQRVRRLERGAATAAQRAERAESEAADARNRADAARAELDAARAELEARGAT